MFGIGSTELMVILVVALLVLGPKSLPQIARTIGKAMGEFRKVSTEFQRTLNTEIAFEDEAKAKAEREKKAEEAKRAEAVQAEAAAPVESASPKASAPESNATPSSSAATATVETSAPVSDSVLAAENKPENTGVGA